MKSSLTIYHSTIEHSTYRHELTVIRLTYLVCFVNDTIVSIVVVSLSEEDYKTKGGATLSTTIKIRKINVSVEYLILIAHC